jgi:hypothetical protein
MVIMVTNSHCTLCIRDGVSTFHGLTKDGFITVSCAAGTAITFIPVLSTRIVRFRVVK